MKPQLLKGFAGFRNDIPEERFTPADLSVATNVDTDETGRVYRRNGFTKLASRTAAHSLYHDGVRTYFADGDTLYRLESSFAATTMTTGLTSGAPLTYVTVNDLTYWSNSNQSGVLTPTGNRSFGLVPPPIPTLTATIGSFPAGKYGVTVTYVRNDGQESGAPEVKTIEVGANSGITIDCPASADPTVTRQNIYITMTNSEVPMLAGTRPNSQTSSTFSAREINTLALRTLARTPLPAARVLGYYNGRVYAAAGQYLFHSDAYNFELMDPVQNVLPFDSRINTVAPVVDGIYVGTETATYFLSGPDPSEFTRRLVSPYGTLWGASPLVPGDFVTKEKLSGNVRLWMSKKGPCYGADGGVFNNMTSTRIVMGDAQYSANLFRAYSGTYHFVSSVFS